MSADFKTEKMYTYCKGFFAAMNWTDALNALVFAKKQHDGVTRKDGVTPYLVHPLTITCHTLALGIRDEAIIAAELMHDIPEDCHVPVEDLPVANEEIKHIVRLLTHEKGVPLAVYYKQIATNPKAMLAKLFDRCDNVSTMAGVFKLQKTESYIQETNEYVMPLYRAAKNAWPQYSSALFVLKYHIMSVVDGLADIITDVRVTKDNNTHTISDEEALAALNIQPTPLSCAIVQYHKDRNIPLTAKNLTAFAVECGMITNTLVEYMDGKKRPTNTVILNLANKLTIDIKEVQAMFCKKKQAEIMPPIEPKPNK